MHTPPWQLEILHYISLATACVMLIMLGIHYLRPQGNEKGENL